TFMTGRARNSSRVSSAPATWSRAKPATKPASALPAPRCAASEPSSRPATVTRQVFLGGSRDYMVELKDGTQLRVVTAAGESIAQGSAVWLVLPPEKCRALLA